MKRRTVDQLQLFNQLAPVARQHRIKIVQIPRAVEQCIQPMHIHLPILGQRHANGLARHAEHVIRAFPQRMAQAVQRMAQVGAPRGYALIRPQKLSQRRSANRLAVQ